MAALFKVQAAMHLQLPAHTASPAPPKPNAYSKRASLAFCKQRGNAHGPRCARRSQSSAPRHTVRCTASRSCRQGCMSGCEMEKHIAVVDSKQKHEVMPGIQGNTHHTRAEPLSRQLLYHNTISKQYSVLRKAAPAEETPCWALTAAQ